ncbi:hypothetical protein RF55_10853 [Lasius niger]|uniref:Uncharacterized protein n=1 Tax=Lasius niger TaxID=67767 RepID=A0A0J7KGV9_LASNI|nr:hypothetical protein RF55_10853 [Lasius niger]
MGAAAFDAVCDRLNEEDPFQATFEAIKAFIRYLPAEPLEIVENFKFHQRKPEEGESIQQFITALHMLCALQIWRILKNCTEEPVRIRTIQRKNPKLIIEEEGLDLRPGSASSSIDGIVGQGSSYKAL